MQDLLQARRVFDAGVLALGISVDGQEAARDLDYARRAFTRATELFGDMGDAWLGRVAAGDRSPEVFFNLNRTRRSIFTEQRRLGLDARTIFGRFNTGMYIEYPLSDAVEAAAAYAASSIVGADYDEAEAALDEIAPKDRTPIVDYVRGLLHFKTQRWPDVLDALSNSLSWEDDYLAAAGHVVVGSSCVQLGLFGEGIRRLELAEAGPIPQVVTAAMFTRGLALREQGKEPEARALFEAIYSKDPGFEDNAKALHDPKFRLVVTTADVIASRTRKWDPDSAPSPEELAATEAREGNETLLAQAQGELDEQIGLMAVKTQVAKLQSAAQLSKIRADRGLATAARSLHLSFTGPPGTGKTTVARIVAKIYCGLGLLKTDQVVECSRKDFVGQHLGETALKTGALIDSAMDGVLFIDEAYTLIQTGLQGGDAFGREAVDTLLARMENDRDRLVVIIAGYDGEIDRFLASNDGLASRFAKRIRFDSYTPDELARIGELIARKRDSTLSEAAYDALVSSFEPLFTQTRIDQSGEVRRAIDIAGNGRFVRNVIESAEEEREFRLSSGDIDLAELDHDALMRIEEQDVRAATESVIGMMAR